MSLSLTNLLNGSVGLEDSRDIVKYFVPNIWFTFVALYHHDSYPFAGVHGSGGNEA